MKKMKMALLAVAIITAVTGAFAAKAKFDCLDLPQYYKMTEGVYLPTGTYGVHYYCAGSITQTCTYYQSSPGVYVACRTGSYSPITP